MEDKLEDNGIDTSQSLVNNTNNKNETKAIDTVEELFEETSTPCKLTKKQEFIKFLTFVGFSISAGIIQMVTFTLLNELATLPYWPSYLIALTASVIYNFTINRRFTFRSANNIPLAMSLVILYYCVFTPLSTWWGNALTAIGWNEYIVLFGTMVINMVTEFLFCRFVVYRKSINTRTSTKTASKQR